MEQVKRVGLLLSVLLCIALVPVASFASKRTVFVHLFEWTWKDIALECETFLGPNGFSAVQISPPQEHAVLPGFPWYQRYQPVSYKLESRSGTRAELADMINRCSAAGVQIYADAVINHMSWVNRSGQVLYGSAGTPYGEYVYKFTYSPADFHACGRNGDDSIKNYQDRWEVQNCNLSTCADLRTESEYVRTRISDYLNDLLGLGVSGFRIDAAKHMPVSDLQAILSNLKRPAFIYNEVIDFGTEPIKSSEYFGIGPVSEFRYGRELAKIFRSGKLAWLDRFGEAWGFVPSSRAIVAIDTHDTQRGHGGGGEVLNYKDGRLYFLANVFMLAWPYGYPQIMSSYEFQNSDQGPPSDSNGRTRPVFADRSLVPNCFKEWKCEHRSPGLVRMVGFRNFTDGAEVTKWWTDGNNQIAFARGNKGYVVINKDNKPLKNKFITGLSQGRYCDILTAKVSAAGDCGGLSVDVGSDGAADIFVPANSALAIQANFRIK